MQISEQGISLIKAFESFVPTLYLDAVNVVTIGYGHAVKLNGKLLKGNAGRTKAKEQFPNPIGIAEADSLLRQDLLEFQTNVFELTKTIPGITQPMFDALVSFDFNTGALAKSTLLQKLKAKDFKGAANEFDKWVYGTINSKKVKLKGLERRRMAEKDLFLSGLKLL